MGLDMYLSKKHYLYGDRDKLKITGVKGINSKKVESISEEFGYWRKANQIHNWFVENVQDGEDNCKEYGVSIEQLKELKKLCEKVLKNHKLAKELLPTQAGFFFGETNYDKYYFKELKDTIKIIDEALKCEKVNFYYSSSW